MSMPNVPEINARIEAGRDVSADLLLASIAFEELGLAHIINAEAEKIQFALGTLDKHSKPLSVDEVLRLGKSIDKVLKKIIDKEILLMFRLEDITELMNQNNDEPIMPESIELDHESASLYFNETKQLEATVLPQNSPYREVMWSSSDTSIAAVSDSGLVSPVAPGQAGITAMTVNNLTAGCRITVMPVEPSSITLDITKISLQPTETQQLAAMVLPPDAMDKSVIWTSDSPSVATVSESGLVTAIAPIVTTITAETANGLMAKCTVTVPSIEMLLNDLESYLGSGYDAGKFIKKGTYDNVLSSLNNAQKQYELGHISNAIKQLENMISILQDESGKNVDSVFAGEAIDKAEKLINRLNG